MIYVITLFYIKSGIVERERTIGWFSSFEEADGSVRQNNGDMYEYGEFNIALVEEVSSGLYPKPREFWYSVDVLPERYNPLTQDFDLLEYNVERCEKPGIFEKIGSFAIG